MHRKFRIAYTAIPNFLLALFIRQKKYPTSPYKKVGIYKVDRYGDAVLCLGALRILISHFGENQCVLIGSRFTKEIVITEFPNLEIVIAPFGHNKLWLVFYELWKLRKLRVFEEGVESMICLRHQRTHRDTAILKAIPTQHSWGRENQSEYTDIPEQLGYRDYSFSNITFNEKPLVNECIELTSHRSLIKKFLEGALCIESVYPKFDKILVKEELNVVISPFGSNSMRDIPESILASILKSIEGRGLNVCLLAEGSQITKYLTLAAKLKNIYNIEISVMQTNGIADFLQQISSAFLVISVESLAAHVATALNKRLLVLVGGGHFGQFSPWCKSVNQVWVTNHLDCFYCQWKCHRDEVLCITGISESAVKDKVINLLKGRV